MKALLVFILTFPTRTKLMRICTAQSLPVGTALCSVTVAMLMAERGFAAAPDDAPARSIKKSEAGLMKGPLRVHPQNPRYFTDDSGKPIFLTGAHTWSNLQDQGTTNPPPVFDFDRYLSFLEERNHNFIRLWAWEQARWAPWSDGKAPNPSDWFIQPNPYARSGPGLARDGKPSFDLAKFDGEYFQRLRDRVRKAGERGIYVSVMLFQGWSSAKGWLGGKPWLGHPFHPGQQYRGI